MNRRSFLGKALTLLGVGALASTAAAQSARQRFLDRREAARTIEAGLRRAADTRHLGPCRARLWPRNVFAPRGPLPAPGPSPYSFPAHVNEGYTGPPFIQTPPSRVHWLQNGYPLSPLAAVADTPPITPHPTEGITFHGIPIRTMEREELLAWQARGPQHPLEHISNLETAITYTEMSAARRTLLYGKWADTPPPMIIEGELHHKIGALELTGTDNDGPPFVRINQ